MPVTTKKVAAAGFTHVRYGLLNEAADLLGSTDNLIAGSQAGSSMQRLQGAKTAPLGNNESETVASTGDDQTIAQFEFDPADLPSGVMTTNIQDFDFEALVKNLTVRNMGGSQWLMTGQPKGADLAPMALILQRRARSQSDGEVGSKRWEVLIIPQCTINPLDSDAFTEKTAAEYRYKITTTMSDAMPWGETFSTSLWGTCQVVAVKTFTENLVNIQAWRGDGVETVFNFSLAPVTAADTIVAVDGVVMPAGYVIDPVAKTITFTVAPAADALIHVYHQYDEGC